MATRYRVGTSGWQYKHWRANFYPKGLPQKQWFAHYAGCFGTVELNNSFYRQPKDSQWDSWAEAAPRGFRFAVKANRFLTHIKRFKDVEEPLERFLSGATRLGPHLGPILYQTPPNFQRSEENIARLEALFALLPKGKQHAFEFRHQSWLGDETLNQLRRHGLGFCVHDKSELKCPFAVTASFLYLRMHGTDGRYGGNYTDALLEGWAQRIKDVSRDIDDAWVYFNNDLGGHAPVNARRLLEILGV